MTSNSSAPFSHGGNASGADHPADPAELDSLIGAVVRTVEHAITLQNVADQALVRLKASVDRAEASAETIKSLETSLDVRIASRLALAVKEPFDKAIQDAAERIEKNVRTAKLDLDASVAKLQATARQVQADIEDQANRLQSRMWLLGAGATLFGVALATVVFHVLG